MGSLVVTSNLVCFKSASFGSHAFLLNWLTMGCPSSKCNRIQQCAIIRILPLLLPWNFSDERRVPKGPIAEPDKMADHQKSRTTSETSDWSLRAIAMIPQRRGSEASSTSSSLSSSFSALTSSFFSPSTLASSLPNQSSPLQNGGGNPPASEKECRQVFFDCAM